MKKFKYLVLAVSVVCAVVAVIFYNKGNQVLTIDYGSPGWVDSTWFFVPALVFGLLALIAGIIFLTSFAKSKNKAQKRATPVYNLPPTQKVDSVGYKPSPTAPVRKQRETVSPPSSVSPTEKVGGSLSRLGNYQLIRLLGEGGFAEVYLGEHIHLSTQAAIKVLHAQLASDDVATFRTEARTVARLIHPHIIRVLDFGVEGKIPFLVMDYAPLGTLRKAHPRGTALPLSTIVSYVKQVAEALQYAHDEKFIHRDVKPENMLIGRRNEVLLGDFGIAVIAHNTYSQRAQGMSGTIAYMAPEQILEYPRQASDQYSLGVVVYEWLTGNIPFQGSPPEILAKHISIAPAPLRQKVPTISSAVERVVLKALAKDPKDRFESVRAFAAALERAAMV